MKEKNTGIRRKILFIFHKRRSVCRDREKAFPLYAGAPDLLRSAFPWGLCPAQRIEMNMTAGGSHTATKWPQSGRMRGGGGLWFPLAPCLPLTREVAPKVPEGVSYPKK